MSDLAVPTLPPTASGPHFPELFAKTAVAHTITYMLMGIIASTAFNYRDLFARPEIACYMRQLSDPWVMAGPLFQPLRGLISLSRFIPSAQRCSDENMVGR